MNKAVILGSLAIVLAVGLGYAYFKQPTLVENEFSLADFDLAQYKIESLTKVGDKELFTAIPGEPLGSSASPTLFISDASTGKAVRLGSIGHSDQSLQWSPDKLRLFLAAEDGITVISAGTLEYERVYTPETGKLHGLLSGYPFFYPKVRWIDDSTIEASIYPTDKAYAEEPVEPAPLEILTIKVTD